MKKPLLIVFLVLLIDQVSKILVKTNMYLGQDFAVAGDWFYIHFTENNGMAFGLEFWGGEFGKLFLSVFRLLAVSGIVYYLWRIVKEKAPFGYIVSISLILAGAIGNILDSAFYGMLFNDSYHQISSMFPENGGYAPLLQGKVVDMLYFPMISGRFPDWLPMWGGDSFLFFRPVFNIADTSISVGVGLIILFQKRFFATNPKSEESPSDENAQDISEEASPTSAG